MSAADDPATIPTSTAVVPVPALELVVEREDGAATTRTVIVGGDVVRVGSHESNDLVVADPHVSRFHLRLTRTATGWRVEDTGSKNGTRVAGVPVRDADLVFPECRLQIGHSQICVRERPTEEHAPIAEGITCGALYGISPTMRRLFHLITKVAAKSDVTVLVEGETGTGKELVASEIVRHGKRADKPLVVVDCGAIPPHLVESELFGHARGAFTGAGQARVGAFEAADGGTVFLDEIGELPLEIQPRLLRALAQREVRRLGENHARPVDVRIIAATNRRLEDEVNSGRFREDLYYRLAVVTLRVPPLRDRLEDLPVLVHRMLAQLGAEDARDVFTPALFAEMATHHWPGNVRELRNFVERHAAGVASVPSPARVAAAALALEVDVEKPFKTAKDEIVEAFERRYLTALFAWAEGNVSKAARKGGIDRMHMHRLLQRHGISRPG